MFDYFEIEWAMEDLTEEELAVLYAEYDKLDYRSIDFEDFCEDYIHNLCYGDC